MMAVVLLLAPLMAVAQPRAREARPDSSADRSRGDMQVVNDLRDEVSVSLWSEHRERLGEWSIRPGENVVLQERGARIRVRSNDKMKLGDDGGVGGCRPSRPVPERCVACQRAGYLGFHPSGPP
jgi:hypothetical protein